jgi:hypothetical protein
MTCGIEWLMKTTPSPSAAHAAYEVEDVVGLDDAESGRRLVEEDHLLRPGRGPGHRDALPLAPGHGSRPAR